MQNITDNEGVQPNRHSLSGVVSLGGVTIEGVLVRLYSKSLKNDQPVGETETDDCGRYWISYDPDKARQRGRKTIDLVVRADWPNGDVQPYESDTIYRAKPTETLAIALLPRRQEESEWSRLEAAIPELLTGRDPTELTEEEARYVSGTTGLPLHYVLYWIDAQRLHSKGSSVDPSTYYGLLRGGMPADLAEASAYGQEEWERLIRNAQLFKRIPPLAEKESAATIRALGGVANRYANLAAEGAKRAESEPESRNSELRADSRESNKGALSHYARLLSVQPDIQVQAASSPEKASQKRTSPDRTPALPLDDRSSELLRKEKNMFPELDWKEALAEAGRTGTFRNPIRECLARFLEESSDFDWEGTVIDRYVQSESSSLIQEEEPVRAAVASRLKALQRVYQISPRYEHMSELLGNGLDSALSVVSYSQAAFVGQFQDALGGMEEARQVYARAEQVNATAAHLYASAYQAMFDVTPAALGGSAMAEQLRKNLPDWASLFGRIDMCDCAECRSVYSAASYFVELLQFLNPKTIPPGMTEKPIEALRRHRPDLEHLQLTCENTNTTLPYIDLVNEVLESYITRGAAVVNNTSPSSDAEDLNVKREYGPTFTEDITKDAASALRSAVFPLSLPYDRHFHATREYLDNMGTSLHELVEVFPDEHPDYARAGDYLGLSSAERNLWMGRTECELWEFYGYDSALMTGPGLLGAYYPNESLSGNPLFTRIDSKLDFDWRGGSPAPTLPAEYSVRWTGKIVPKTTGMKVLHIDTLWGHRFWFNGQLMTDTFNMDGLSQYNTDSIPLTAGQAYPIVLEFRSGGGESGMVHLQWEYDGKLEHIPADELQYSMPWNDHMARVPEFLSRTGISYDELLELTAARYVNSNPATPNVVLLSFDNPCELESTVVKNLEFDNYAPLRDIHRLLRLQRKTGFSILELDRILSALGRERDTFLPKLAALKRVREVLGEGRADLSELLALWAPLDTQGDSSLYAKLFQNKALMNPPDPDFSLLSGGKEIRGHLLSLDSKLPQLLAVLRLKDADLQAIREETGLAGADAKLTLVNLSILYRYALLGRLLSVSVTNLISLLRLTGASPFSSPTNAIKFLKIASEIEASGIPVEELAFLFRHRELPAQSLPPAPSAIAKLAETLKAEYKRIEEAATGANGGGASADSLKRVFAIQSLAGAFESTEPVIAALAEETLGSTNPATPGAAVLEDFLRLEPESLRTSFLKLHKAALIARRLELEPDEIVYIHANKSDFLGTDFNLLPANVEPSAAAVREWYARWRLLEQYREAKECLLPGMPKLTELFRLAKQAGTTPKKIAERLGEWTGWNVADLTALIGPGGWNLTAADFYGPSKLADVRSAIRLTERLRIPAAKWIAWTKELPDKGIADDVRNAAKSRHSESSWRLSAAAIENRMREQWRDSLVDYVLHLPAIRANGITNGNQLFEYFLIDVEMNADMKTSRIKQAISSVQLFVQRCLLNLEPVVPPKAIDAKQWEWLKNYRTWEANRKIFLYPENWVESELRDDKSPIFEELENELLQIDVNSDNARSILSSYLERMDEIARLDIRAMHRHGDEMHLFGRTYSVPHVYYHRTRRNGGWTAWRKIDADIQGEHLVPYVFNSSLYLFWGILEKEADQKDNNPTNTNDNPSASVERLTIKLGWIEYRNGRWTAKRASEKGLYLQDVMKSTNLESTQLDYYLILQTHNENNLEFMVVNGYKPFDYNRFMSNVCGRIIFNDTRKSTTMFPKREAESLMSYAPQDVDMAGMFLEGPSTGELIVPRFSDDTYSYVETASKLMNQVQGPYRLLVPPKHTGKFVFIDTHRDLEYVHQDYYRTYYAVQSSSNYIPLVIYENLYHPMTRAFVRAYNERGLDGLLSLDTQRLTNETDSNDSVFKKTYEPTTSIALSHPREVVDFSYDGSYSIYNWELFFHIPILIADRLTKERRFAEAQKWFHYVFNPTIDSTEPAPVRYWRFWPFQDNVQENRIWKLLEELADPNSNYGAKERLQNQIADWRANPFQPHRIARMRVGSYQKAVVMKYIDALVAWGDDLFSHDTIESINEATQLYVMAANLLGPRPEHIPELTKSPAKTYAELSAQGLDDFSNALVDVQNRFPYIKVQPVVHSDGTPIGGGVGRSLYFGIPKNDKLLAYWDTVEDRLYKIRNGLSLQGIARKLALFEAPIDPMAVVRAASSGAGGTGSVLTDLSRPLGHYRFTAILPKALELCAEAQALGSELLAALEKKDSEELNVLRARHETSLSRLIRQVKSQQIEEAKYSLEGLARSREVVDYRYRHYKNIEFMNAFEIAQLALTTGSMSLQTVAGIADLASSVAYNLPNVDVGISGWAGSPVVKASFGGNNMGSALGAFSKAMSLKASILATTASMSGTMAGHKRRAEEWKLQEELAARELVQIDSQIASARSRLAIAERELANHDKLIEQSEEMELFLQEKFTNRELYQWLVAQLTNLYFQAYQLAYETAKQAEMAYRFDRGLTDTGFIKFGYWDSLKKGLLASERLRLDLKRLEMAYYDQNAREYELTKTISLAQLDPLALIALRTTGYCTISLPEELFDMDHPGNYMRRIKSVAITVPCVSGPHAGVHGRLTLMSSHIRASKSAAAPYKKQPDDVRFLSDFTAVQSIAVSHGQNDTGLFELSFRDERFLPFEGAGVVSEWKLELPKETNAFDFDTISDIVLKLNYTAREGGNALAEAAFASAVLSEPDPQGSTASPLRTLPGQPNLQRMFSARHEFQSEWHRFLNPAGADAAQTLELKLDPNRFPYRYRGRKLQVSRIRGYLQLRDGVDYPGDGTPLELIVRAPGSEAELPGLFLASESVLHGVPIAEFDVSAEGKGTGDWKLRTNQANVNVLPSELKTVMGDFVRLNAKAIEDLILLFDYSIQ